jgi:sulfatase modifying factor 1
VVELHFEVDETATYPARAGSRCLIAGSKYPTRAKLMRNFVIVFIVLLTMVGAVFSGPQVPPKKHAADLGGGVAIELVLIPAGQFKMGSGESAEDTAAYFNKTYRENFPADGMGGLEANFFENEHPQHDVRITQPFFLGTYPVTRGQFRQFVDATAHKTDKDQDKKLLAWGWDPDKKQFSNDEKYSWRYTGFEQTDEHPVVNVTWNDAIAFCKWLSEKEGQTYRLPTEAEWEYACRAGTTTRYPSGDDPQTLGKVSNVVDATVKARIPDWRYMIYHSDNYAFTSPVGKSKPNAFGLHDMHGNAFQWCSDWYGEKYYAASPADDPTGPDSGSERVIRGGTWNFRPLGARSAERNKTEPDSRNCSAGFRVVRTQ